MGVLLTTCTLPYQPAVAQLDGEPERVFARALDAVRLRYGRVARAESRPLRVQSAWAPHARGTAVGERRATVFQHAPGALGVVVETRYLELGFDGLPRWGTVRADRGLEGELVEALEQEVPR